EMPVRHAGDLRLVGTRIGAVAAWHDDKRVRLVRVEDDADVGTWGRSVRQLCDGAASNDAQFGVGWLEANDSVWIVHGPVAADGAAAQAEVLGERAERMPPDAELARNEWCGVASAEQAIALLWRSADRLRLTM